MSDIQKRGIYEVTIQRWRDSVHRTMDNDPTIREVLGTMNMEQRNVVTYLIQAALTQKEETKMNEIKDIIFNGPATIILWKDGTKTIVKCQDGETYDKEKAIAMAICKKALGDEAYYSLFHLAKEARKDLEKMKRELQKFEKRYSLISERKKKARHKSAVQLERLMTQTKSGIKHCEDIIKKFS